MLSKDLLFREVALVKDRLFSQTSPHYQQMLALWRKIVSDETFQERAFRHQMVRQLPSWLGDLNKTFSIVAPPKTYRVRAVDGSQVYPDRNMPGLGCFLLNIGGIYLRYGVQSQVALFSKPTLYLPEDVSNAFDGGMPSKDIVDLKREELELEESFNGALALGFGCDEGGEICLALFDGSLIFWHLESKSLELQDEFCERYLALLEKFYTHKILLAGCISMPRSRDFINLIKFELDTSSRPEMLSEHLAPFADTDILFSFLGVGQRTGLFQSNSSVTRMYPPVLRPFFFYCNVGSEIVRIEIPAWIAASELYVDRIASIVLDQSQKGGGYPISLAEAHEQAVIKGPDREFFYHVIMKMGVEQNVTHCFSQKSLKKRGIGV